MQARTAGLGRSNGDMALGPGRQQAEQGLGHLLKSKAAWIVLGTSDHIPLFDPNVVTLCSFLSVFTCIHNRLSIIT